MQSILEKYRQTRFFNSRRRNHILSKTETKQFKTKKHFIECWRSGDLHLFCKFGILRSFNINDNIIEHVLHFVCEGWWIGDMYSYISGKPGNLFIEVIEDAEVVIITKENNNNFIKKFQN